MDKLTTMIADFGELTFRPFALRRSVALSETLLPFGFVIIVFFIATNEHPKMSETGKFKLLCAKNLINCQREVDKGKLTAVANVEKLVTFQA